MAERPDLDYALPILARELEGRAIARVAVQKPVVVRIATSRPGDLFESAQVGAVFRGVARRAHFALFALEAPSREKRGIRTLELAVAPMLAGRFRLDPPGTKLARDAAVTWELEDGRTLVYRDDVQMGKVYLLDRGRWEKVPGLAKVGLDALDPEAFTREAFRMMARRRRDQAKVFVMDKSAIDALGNAYGDEVLFEARIHPKAWVAKLGDARVDALHDAIVRVLTNARDVLRERKPPLDEKLRDFLSVRGRAGEACVVCETKLRRAGVHGHDAIFCPSCQPDDRGSALVDWRKLSEIKGKGPASSAASDPTPTLDAPKPAAATKAAGAPAKKAPRENASAKKASRENAPAKKAPREGAAAKKAAPNAARSRAAPSGASTTASSAAPRRAKRASA